MNDTLRRRIINLVFIILSIQMVVASLQLFYGVYTTGSFDRAAGDHLEGTIHLPLRSELSFSNVMFASNMLFLLIFLFPYFKEFTKKRRIIIYISILLFILASVVHITLFAVLSFIICSFFIFPTKVRPKTSQRLAVIIVLLIPFLLMFGLLRKNMKLIPAYGMRIVTGEIPKAKLMYELFTVIPDDYPQINSIGLGPGQFDSKATLIGTGMYFGSPKNPKDIPFIKNSYPPAFEKYVLEKWLEVSGEGDGSTYAPFSSWIAFYAEFGRFSLLIMFAMLFVLTIFIVYKSKQNNKRLQGFSIIWIIWLLFFLGFQEHYWETPQAIFLSLMLIKVLIAQLNSKEKIFNYDSINQ